MKRKTFVSFVTCCLALTISACSTPSSNNNTTSNVTPSVHTHIEGEEVKENYVAPTCTEAGGYDYKVYCVECKELIKEGHKVLPAKGHTPGEEVISNYVDPTCFIDGGNDCDIYCEVCEELLESSHVVIPSGHDYEVSYDWAENYSTCTGTAICKNDGSHVVELTIDSSYEVIREATEILEGLGRYTATFPSDSLFETQIMEVSIPYVQEAEPVIEGNHVQYGIYPQSVVDSSTLISNLYAYATLLDNGWFKYNGEYYVKHTAVLKDSSDNLNYFHNGQRIISGNEYWFKCEPINWRIVSVSETSYYLMADNVLDGHSYHHTNDGGYIGNEYVYANNYKYSDMRAWLNGEFFDNAFMLGGSKVLETLLDNSDTSTGYSGNPFVCEDTLDKVFLPSKSDYSNSSYGFTNDNSRIFKATDYAITKGIFVDSSTQGGSYWTRSPHNSTPVDMWRISFEGEFYIPGDSFKSFTSNLSLHPAIMLKIN